VLKFEIEPHRKKALLEGLDDIGRTMQKGPQIDSFEAKAKAARPWM
jgi:3-isopropylmalate/(R)-2-methylmalate dehydratase small subunit